MFLGVIGFLICLGTLNPTSDGSGPDCVRAVANYFFRERTKVATNIHCARRRAQCIRRNILTLALCLRKTMMINRPRLT